MRKFVSCLMLAVLVVAPFTALAEDEAPAPAEEVKPVPKRAVDPAAMKLVDAAKAKLFSNQDAGLKDLSFNVTMKNPMMSADVVCAVTFEVPDKSEVKLTSLPAEYEAMRDAVEGKAKQEIDARILQFYKNEGFRDLEKFNIAMKEGSKDTIVLTAFAKDAGSARREIKFGEDGLPETMLEAQAMGEVEMAFTYKAVDDKHILAAIQIQHPGGAASFKFEHAKSGKFWLLSKAVLTVEAMGLEMTYAMTDYKVNTKAATPAETPEAPKTPETPGEKPGDGD